MRKDVPGDTVTRAKAALGDSSTISGLWIACLSLATGEMWAADSTSRQGVECHVSVSVLVDLRPYIAPDAATSQAFGTVGVGCKVLPMVDGLVPRA